jgi:ABC-type glycerol-3-phosphate transport system substrate-binding protein
VLAGVAAPVLAGLAGCAGGGKGTVRVYVVWSGDELAAFRAVMAKFSQRERWAVQLQTTGDDIDALLQSQSGRLTRPDVVLLPRSGLAFDPGVHLDPAPDALLDDFPPAWRRLVQPSGRGSDLGVWFKAAHKSLVWYRREVFDAHHIAPPTTVTDWLAVNEQLMDAGVRPLSIGAADGWVLTDWFENLLLGLDKTAYDDLAMRQPPGVSDRDYAAAAERRWRHDAVRHALALLAQLCGEGGAALPGGIDRALLLQFEDSLVDVFSPRRRAAMVAGADFASPVIHRYAANPDDVGVFRFPGQPNRPLPLVVGGDLAVTPHPVQAGGAAALKWLASPEAARIWAARGGFISLLERPEVSTPGYEAWFQRYYTPQRLAEVRHEDSSPPLFDLSDQLTGRLAGADGQGSFRILQDFLVAVGRATSTDDVDTAVTAAVEQFVRAARGEPA